jgi:hypothetical protein
LSVRNAIETLYIVADRKLFEEMGLKWDMDHPERVREDNGI